VGQEKNIKITTIIIMISLSFSCTISIEKDEPRIAIPKDGSNNSGAPGSGSNNSPTPPQSIGGGWNLLWSDEFSGQALDMSKWSHSVNCWGGGNNELQCYTDEPNNTYVKDGMLHIVAIKGDHTGPNGPNGTEGPRTQPYSSGRIHSKGKADFKFGKICMRAKLPYGQGLWPAFWMLPTNSPYGGWAACGEIDIMEAINLSADPQVNSESYGTLHYGGEWPRNRHSGTKTTLNSSAAFNFHEYCIEWELGEFRWYVDGNHYETQRDWFTESKPNSAPMATAPFDSQFHLILNVAVGGNWPGSPNTQTIFPQEMVVDYVRVYQCSVDPTLGQGCATVGPNPEIVIGSRQ
jgi:beta-glucanase (GH16 family)